MTTPSRPARRVISSRSRRRLVAALATLGLAGLSGALSPAITATASPPASTTTLAATSAAGAAVPDDDSSVTQTHDWLDDDGTSRTGTVTVSQTKDLATRQIVDISWSGFMPTVNATGADSVHQAPQAARASGYPVVLMECQGDDAATMTPADCAFPNPNRFYYYAVYDKNETEAVHHASIVDSRDFTETSGKVDHGATGQYVPLPSDYDDSNVLGTTWYATWTNDDGTHQDSRFEVRSVQEAADSLGCGDSDNRSQGACSIVVVPIRPMPCIDDHSCPPPNDYLGLSADYKEWQAASNWRNKFVVPVSFRPFPDVCKLDSRIAVPTQGSEMLNQAMLSWLPKFCQSSDLFKLSFTRINDFVARHNLDYQVAGQYAADLAFTTQPASSIRGRPVVNAPVAVTGFTVAFQIDNSGYEQEDQLNLNARLLAKLVTESYNAPPDPNVDENPQGLFTDPEFAKLNPDLVAKLPPAIVVRNPIIVQGSPDLVYEVTRYIASDPEAMAWLGGKADPWGMKVNPYYAGSKWQLPADTFEQRDPYIWKDDSRQCTPKPIMEQVAQYVFDLGGIADAMINRQPQDYTVCKLVSGDDVFDWVHSDRQTLGSRAMLAIMDIPSADTYQFPMAALQNHAGTYVTPSNDSLQAALDVATYDAKTGTLSTNLKSTSKDAYPGMMPVYAAAPTHGLTTALAASYAKMITWLSTTGQTYGDAAGQLPNGYLALTPKLRAQAAAAAAHVRNQDCAGQVAGETACSPPTTPPPTTPPVTTPAGTSTPPTGSYGDPTTGSQAPGGGLSPTTAISTTPVTTAPVTSSPSAEPVSYTASQKSGLAMHLLPVLLVVGLLGLLAAPVLVLLSRPGGSRSPLEWWESRRRKGASTPKTPKTPKTPSGGSS
jgi:hypothetical protein